MKRTYCLIASFIAIIGYTTMTTAQETIKPPVAKKEPKVLKIHGYEITVNYGWLRDRGKDKNS